MNEGRKDDKGKVDLTFNSEYFPRALMAVAKVSEFGATKYNRNNWVGVKDAKVRYRAAMLRHELQDWNEKIDSESKLLHLAHVAWNALAILELELKAQENKASIISENVIPKQVALYHVPYGDVFTFYLHGLPLKCKKVNLKDKYFLCTTETPEFPTIRIHESAMVTPIAAIPCQTPPPPAHPGVPCSVNPSGTPPSAPMPPPCDGLAAVQKRAQSAS